MAHNFLSEVVVLEIKNFTSAAATGIIETGVHGTAGYESIVAITRFGATNSSGSLHALGGSASASGGLSELVNTSIAALSTGAGLEIHRPPAYVQFQAVREASMKLGEIWVLGYKPRTSPPSHSTGLFTSRIVNSPSTGQSTSTA